MPKRRRPKGSFPEAWSQLSNLNTLGDLWKWECWCWVVISDWGIALSFSCTLVGVNRIGDFFSLWGEVRLFLRNIIYNFVYSNSVLWVSLSFKLGKFTSKVAWGGPYRNYSLWTLPRNLWIQISIYSSIHPSITQHPPTYPPSLLPTLPSSLLHTLIFPPFHQSMPSPIYPSIHVAYLPGSLLPWWLT